MWFFVVTLIKCWKRSSKQCEEKRSHVPNGQSSHELLSGFRRAKTKNLRPFHFDILDFQEIRIKGV